MEVLYPLRKPKANILAVSLIFSVEKNKTTLKVISITGCSTSGFSKRGIFLF